MTLDQFVGENLWGIIVGGAGLIFTVATIYATVRFSLKQVSGQVQELTSDVQGLAGDMRDKDAMHDQAIGNLRERMVKVETEITLLQEIRGQVNDMWKHMMRGKD